MTRRSPASIRGCGALLAVLLLVAAGCASPGFVVSRWDSGLTGSLQTRCERLDFNHRGALQEAFVRHDGWKLIYLAQPDINALHFDGLACFERNGVNEPLPPLSSPVESDPAGQRPEPPDAPTAPPPRKSMGTTPTF